MAPRLSRFERRNFPVGNDTVKSSEDPAKSRRMPARPTSPPRRGKLSVNRLEVDPSDFDTTMTKLRGIVDKISRVGRDTDISHREKEDLGYFCEPPFPFLCALYGFSKPTDINPICAVADSVIKGIKDEQTWLREQRGKQDQTAQDGGRHVAAIEAALVGCDKIPAHTPVDVSVAQKAVYSVYIALCEALRWCIATFMREPRGALWDSWQPLFAQRDLTPAQAAVLCSLAGQRGMSLGGGDEINAAANALRGALSHLTPEQRQPSNSWKSFEAARIASLARLVGESQVGRQILQQIQQHQCADDQASEAAWYLCEREGQRGPALQCLVAVDEGLKHAQTWLNYRAKMYRKGSQEEQYGAMLQDCVTSGAKACQAAVALGGRSARRELQRHNFEVALARARQGGRPQPLSADMPHALVGGEDRSTEDLAASIDKVYDRRIAADARRAHESLRGFRCLQQRSSVSLAIMPTELMSMADKLQEELAGRAQVADATRLRIRQELTDSRHLCSAIDVAARADNLLYRQVDLVAASTEVRLAVEKGLSGIARALAAVPRTPPAAPRTPTGTSWVDASSSTGGSGEEDTAETEPTPMAQEVAALSGLSLSSPERPQEDIDEGFDSVGSASRRACLRDRQMARAHFSAGTFASAWASAKYHFHKHASHLEGATIAAYIERALPLRAHWQQASQCGKGWSAPDVANNSKAVRVMSTAEAWLVITDEDDGKIISYRDRTGQNFVRST